jgi:acylphosphatase
MADLVPHTRRGGPQSDHCQEGITMFNPSRRLRVVLATLVTWTLLAIAPASADSTVTTQSVIAVSGVVTGNVQQVGFRAMIQKQAIQYNLAGTAENNPDKSVRFVLQGIKDRIDEALKAIRKGTKKSSDVNVTVSSSPIDPNMKTFTAVGWTSVSRHISHPYNLVFDLRDDDKEIGKDEAKAVWLGICQKTVKGEDIGKCDKADH